MTEKQKRKHPCWNCAAGQGNPDKAFGTGTPFDFYKCDWCGARWSYAPRFSFDSPDRPRVMDMRIKPEFADAVQWLHAEIVVALHLPEVVDFMQRMIDKVRND